MRAADTIATSPPLAGVPGLAYRHVKPRAEGANHFWDLRSRTTDKRHQTQDQDHQREAHGHSRYGPHAFKQIPHVSLAGC